jgi:phosphopantothenoylcysteine decarboxylase/phosphopantothenate--cysteine ligase
MDEDMWHHPATKENLTRLSKFGNQVIPVGFGDLASGLVGPGRMAEPEEIVSYLSDFFSKKGELTGKKALVTAGPTYEAMDPVRFIGNHSSGKMGIAIAEELLSRGAEVTLVCGPVADRSAANAINTIAVSSADEMYTACMEIAYDIAVMAAAVADYRPKEVAPDKIKKSGEELTLTLVKTKDILAGLGKQKKAGQVLVGFALETSNEAINAQKKLKDKNADLIVLNSLNDEGAGFGYDTNKVSLFFRTGEERSLPLKPKTELAKDIVDTIIELVK